MEVTDKLKGDIYVNYLNKVIRYINGQINNYSQAEEMASEIFLKIFEKLDSFDESKSSLSTWIYTITRNYLFDYYRTKKDEVSFDETFMVEVDEDEGIYTEENLEKLAVALEGLNDKEKKIIVGHYYEKRSLKEIASELCISYIYAKVLHSKALDKMKKYFKN